MEERDQKVLEELSKLDKFVKLLSNGIEYFVVFDIWPYDDDHFMKFSETMRVLRRTYQNKMLDVIYIYKEMDEIVPNNVVEITAND